MFSLICGIYKCNRIEMTHKYREQSSNYQCRQRGASGKRIKREVQSERYKINKL